MHSALNRELETNCETGLVKFDKDPLKALYPELTKQHNRGPGTRTYADALRGGGRTLRAGAGGRGSGDRTPRAGAGSGSGGTILPDSKEARNRFDAATKRMQERLASHAADLAAQRAAAGNRFSGLEVME
jgi:hypothetical protein